MTNKEAVGFLDNMKSEPVNYGELVGAPSPYLGIHYVHTEPEDYAIDLAIKALELQEKERWIPVSEGLPEDDGEYLCTVEWYGTSTKELLTKNGYEIEIKIKLVHFLDSIKSFKEHDEFCTYRVLAWKNQESYKENLF